MSSSPRCRFIATIAIILSWALVQSPAKPQETVTHPPPLDLETAQPAPLVETRLTLTEARDLALRANPELRAARLDIRIAEAELGQASLLLQSNPSIDVLAGGPGTEIGVSQELEVAGQRGARRGAFLAGVDRATARVLDGARSMIADVDRAFYRLAAAIQREQLAEEVLALNRRLEDAASRQLAAGDISEIDRNLAVVELGRARSRALAVRRERESNESELARLLGLDAGTRLSPFAEHSSASASGGGTPAEMPSPSALSVEQLTEAAIAHRPDIAERAAGARQARSLAKLARREALPNLALRAVSEPQESGNRAARVGVGLSIPIFNRNRREAEARAAEAEQAELERTALVARVRSEVARAVSAYRLASDEVDALRTTVLEPARENRRLLEIAYGAGKVGIPVLLLIRNQAIDAEFQYWEAWLAMHEALTDLREATGESATLAPAP